MPKVMNQNHNLMKMLQAITKEAKLILRELVETKGARPMILIQTQQVMLKRRQLSVYWQAPKPSRQAMLQRA